ncbi:leucine-rich repeat protein [Skeletonema marinoi]|uniref:Leucine-rich repeat protein n=1 Tax=Skeletonema marinoi TaxID=267567 RepID=A0AAD9D6L0_9STRA|nr:leucine-rich repeat protein [Skeletonema marinoi]
MDEFSLRWMIAESQREHQEFYQKLMRAEMNDPTLTEMTFGHFGHFVHVMDEEEFESFGETIARNTHIKVLFLGDHNLGDENMQALFRGLTRSSSIEELNFSSNRIGTETIRSMVPFLQNASNLKKLYVSGNNITSEGFKVLWRELTSSQIEELHCAGCGVASIEIDIGSIPPNLEKMSMSRNNINTDGCRELAKLLQCKNSALTELLLVESRIDDEGVAILVDALENNTSLEKLTLQKNEGITMKGKALLLKLVNDVSSIAATLQSNHTLQKLTVDEDSNIQRHINHAVDYHVDEANDPEEAGREKVIQTQLNSVERAELVALQGVDCSLSLYSEIDPLYLPEVLELVQEYHGMSELYVALKSSAPGLISIVNRKEYILQQRAYHAALVAEHAGIVDDLDAELAVIEEGSQVAVSGSKKRRRTALDEVQIDVSNGKADHDLTYQSNK